MLPPNSSVGDCVVDEMPWRKLLGAASLLGKSRAPGAADALGGTAVATPGGRHPEGGGDKQQEPSALVVVTPGGASDGVPDNVRDASLSPRERVRRDKARRRDEEEQELNSFRQARRSGPDACTAMPVGLFNLAVQAVPAWFRKGDGSGFACLSCSLSPS